MFQEAAACRQLSGHSLLSDLAILDGFTQRSNDQEDKSQSSTWRVTFLIVFILIALLVILVQKKHSYWKKKGVPYTKPSFLIGNTFQRLGLSTPFYKYLDDAYNNCNGRDFCGFFEFTTPGVIVGNSQLLQSMLVQNFDHFCERRTFKLKKVSPIANKMLTNASGHEWKEIRSVVQRTFTLKRALTIDSLIQDRLDRLLENLKQMTQLEECCIPTRTLCAKYMMDAIASCAFGIELETSEKEGSVFTNMAAKVLQLSWRRAFKVVLLITMPWVTDIAGWLGYDMTSPEFQFFREVIKCTRKKRRDANTWRGDFLDLMDDTKKLSEESILAQSVLFLLAGYANTSNGLALVLHLLASQPQEQAALRRELYETRKDSNGSYGDLRCLPYLTAVVDETLRLYPGGPIIERVCTKDYTLDGTDITLTVGQPVIVPVWSIHRDSIYWSNPLQFQPKRFLPQNRSQIRNYTYLPFGVGPRSCVGIRFADMTIKKALAEIIINYKVTLCSDHSTNPPPLHPKVLTLKPANLVPLKFSPITDLNQTIKEELITFPVTEDEQIAEQYWRQK